MNSYSKLGIAWPRDLEVALKEAKGTLSKITLLAYSKKKWSFQHRNLCFGYEIRNTIFSVPSWNIGYLFKHFRYFVEGREITALADQKPLTYNLTKKKRSVTCDKLATWISFSTSIGENLVVVALSRLKKILSECWKLLESTNKTWKQ